MIFEKPPEADEDRAKLIDTLQVLFFKIVLFRVWMLRKCEATIGV
jgi:hypothetical protein